LRDIFFINNYEFIEFGKCAHDTNPEHVLYELYNLACSVKDKQPPRTGLSTSANDGLYRSRAAIENLLLSSINRRCLILEVLLRSNSSEARAKYHYVVVKFGKDMITNSDVLFFPDLNGLLALNPEVFANRIAAVDKMKAILGRSF